MRSSLALLAALAIGCVDGKTPDCSTPQSGCFPGDGGTTPTDASDGASDAPPDVNGDALTDAATD